MKKILFACAVASLVFLSSCVGTSRQLIEKGGKIPDGTTVVVGKIIVYPPLTEKDQKLEGIGVDPFRNSMIIINDTKHRKIDMRWSPEISELDGRIEAPIGETFYAMFPNKPFYMLAGVIYLEIGINGYDTAYFPMDFKVNIRPGDKLVYIGTIRYYRNEFWQVTKVVVEDHYNKEMLRARKMFGRNIKMRKAIPKIKMTKSGKVNVQKKQKFRELK